MYCELMERGTIEPTGRYLAHEAGMLAGVPGDRIGQLLPGLRAGQQLREHRHVALPALLVVQRAAEVEQLA